MTRAINKYTILYVLDTIFTIVCLILGSIAFHFIRITGINVYDISGMLLFEMAMIFALAILMFVRIVCQSSVLIKYSVCWNMVSFLATILLLVILYNINITIYLNVYEVVIFVLGQFMCSIVYDLYRIMKH